MEVQIIDKGKVIFRTEPQPKTFKSGKKGFYAGIMLTTEGKIHRGNFMIYEVE